jgi:hypothetical protein
MTGGLISLKELIETLRQLSIEGRGAMKITLNIDDSGDVAKIEVTEFFKRKG